MSDSAVLAKTQAGIFKIALKMISSGLPVPFVHNAIKFASLNEGIHDLMLIWDEVESPSDRDILAADIQDLLDDIICDGTENNFSVQYKELADLSNSVQSFKERLLKKIEAQGLSITMLSEMTSLPVSALNRFFEGFALPQKATVLKIIEAIGINRHEVAAIWYQVISEKAVILDSESAIFQDFLGYRFPRELLSIMRFCQLQTFRIFNNSDGSAPNFGVTSKILTYINKIYLAMVSSISNVVSENLMPPPITSTGNGSFLIEIAIPNEDAWKEASSTFTESLSISSSANPDFLQALTRFGPETIESYTKLLEIIIDKNIGIEFNQKSILSSDATEYAPINLNVKGNKSRIKSAHQVLDRLLANRKELGIQLHSSLVPQADNFSTVINILLFTHPSSSLKNEYDSLAEYLNIDPRQVNYYKHAAKILGLLDEDSHLTERGECLCNLSNDDQLKLSCIYFEDSAVGRSWIEWSEGNTLKDVDPDSAEEFLNSVVNSLSANTSHRRAQTLKSWYNLFIPFHYSSYKKRK